MHRVATALLSGAGILVLLPALERDAVLQVLRALLGVGDRQRWRTGPQKVGEITSVAM